MMKKNILIIAGEPSGDVRASELLREFKKLESGSSFWGIGGDRMKKEGVRLLFHVRDLSMVGIWEVAKNLNKIRRQYSTLTNAVKERKPDLAILVDYPGFNLRVAKFLHGAGIPVLYYIIPQVWAWGPGRIELIKKYTDKTLVLFKFEEDLLKEHGINCEFVGHPLVDTFDGAETCGQERRFLRQAQDTSSKDTEQSRSAVSIPGTPGALDRGSRGVDPAQEASSLERTDLQTGTIALLPGSRMSEITRMLPTMLMAAEKMRALRKDISFVIAESSNIPPARYEKFLSLHPDIPVTRVKDDTFKALAMCDFAIVTSGTATLETAVMGKPMIIVYKVAFITGKICRLLMRVPFLGLVNIIAKKEIVPEFLQEDASPEKISSKALEILGNDRETRRIKKDLEGVRNSLGEKGASRRAAEAVMRFARSL